VSPSPSPTRALLSSLVCLLGACAGELQTPIPTAAYPAPTPTPRSTPTAANATPPEAPTGPRTLVVMLPGAGDRVGTYDEHGFVELMHDSGMDVDILEVDAHYGYYRSRTLLERMEQDVLGPNRGRYQEIWVVGISMGGIGALLTAHNFPEDIDGLILMAPYLGRRKTLRAIDAAGGLARWQPPAKVDEQQWDVEIWRMLKGMSEDRGQGSDSSPELYLMYGEEDFGVRAHELLADALPPGRVKTTSGGHSWETWTKLWTALMAEQPLG